MILSAFIRRRPWIFFALSLMFNFTTAGLFTYIYAITYLRSIYADSSLAIFEPILVLPIVLIDAFAFTSLLYYSATKSVFWIAIFFLLITCHLFFGIYLNKWSIANYHLNEFSYNVWIGTLPSYICVICYGGYLAINFLLEQRTLSHL